MLNPSTRIVLTLLASLAVLPALAQGVTKGNPSGSEHRLTRLLREHARAGETVAWQRTLPLPATGMELVRAKFLDTATGEVRELTLDARSGTPVPYDEALREEERAWRARHGAATRELSARLETAAPNDVLSVWVVARAGRERELRAALEDTPVTLHRDRPEGIELSATAEVIDRLRHVPVLDAMTLAPERRPLALDNAKDVGQPAVSASHELGVGVGWLMAVWEPEACISRAHPDFQSVVWRGRPGGSDCDPLGRWVGHSTHVASALVADRRPQGTVGLFRGGLVDIDDTLDSAVEAMWRLDPVIVNASFSTAEPDGRRIDQEVYARGSFVFTGAGNNGGAGYARCWAYNALCVGGYDDKGTHGFFGDDSLWARTTYRNNRSGREVPHVAGPANASKLARGSSGHTAESGTSYSTPAVAGLAGLLTATHPFDLWRRPALMRAVLMASAQAHPIADPNGGWRVPDFDDGNDDRVGVGAPNGARAHHIVTHKAYFYDSTFEPADLGRQVRIPVGANERLRVVLAWDQCPGYSTWMPQLNADFDMVLEAPAGQFPRPPDRYSNLSGVDNWEVIEVTTLLPRTFTVKLSAPRWSPCDDEGGRQRVRLALAWATEPASVITE
ncbi:S8 family serine peptidase [Archangium violaceum]|uniref:S8 family serine peptidase n=1 Tax=Archangium violaceum TaxID=83451 RepID=UPI0037BEE879